MDILSFIISAFFSLVTNMDASQSAVTPNTQEMPQAPAIIETPETVQIAQCLTSKGVKFYGAFWCPHCADQKKLFGEEAMQYITYVECDPRGENAQPQACIRENIELYPTWIFPDQDRMTGTWDPQELAARAGCTDSV